MPRYTSVPLVAPFTSALRAAASLFLIGLAITLAPAMARAHDNAAPTSVMSPAAAEARQLAEDLTQQLNGLIARYGGATAAQRGQLGQQMLDVAAKRQDLLARLIEDHPEQVVRLALPGRILAAMPTEVQALLEQRQEIEGELEVRHVDYPDPAKTRFVYQLKTSFGERFSLHFAATPPGLVSGTHVRVDGLLLDGASVLDVGESDGALAIESGDSGLEFLAPGGDSGGAATPSSGLTNTFGAQSTLVVLVNFQDKPSEQPITPEQARSVVFDQASSFFLENSYDQTWLSGDAYGWYTIPLASNVCDTALIETYANSAAAAAGVNLSSYDRFVYFFPTNSGCGGWSGAGTVGGFPSKTWINGTFTLAVVGHELGHNFGLFHSHGMNCTGTVVYEPTCPWLQYGDALDIMGNRPGHLNAFQKERLGWLNFGISPPLTTVESSGTYDLAPYELSGTSATALKILRSADAATGRKTWYYLEYRQDSGFDSFLFDPASPFNNPDNLNNGVVVHLGTEGNADSSFLLDMTPDSNTSSASADLRDPALVSGQSYSDAEAGATITTLSPTAGGIAVSVDLGGATGCVRANPQVSLSPSESQWVASGTPQVFTVTVINQDGSGCGSSQFDLIASAPAGWTSAFAAPSLALAPGSSGSTSMTVTSPVSAADGYYDIVATATNAAAASNAGSATATYVVSNATPNQPPVAVNDNAVTAPGTAVTIPVLANDYDSDMDSLSVVLATQGAYGSVAIGANGALTYTPGPKFKSQDSFTYTITDGHGTAAATVIVKKASSGGGKGKPGA